MNSRATAFRTSRYDDYMKGMDVIIALRDLEGAFSVYSGIGIDITRATQRDIIFQKTLRTIEKAKTNTLSDVKYFYDDERDYRGPLDGLTQFTILVDYPHLKDLAAQEYVSNRKGLEENVFQLVLLLQLQLQCEEIVRIAHEYESTDVALAYEEVWVHVGEILESKQDMFAKYPDIQKDPTLETLRSIFRAHRREGK